jgi:hypothetical protein
MHPRSRYRGAFRVSLGISAVLHLLALALYPSFSQGIPEWLPLYGGPPRVTAPPGIELVNLAELPPAAEVEVPVREDPEPERPEEVEEEAPAAPVLPGPERPGEAEDVEARSAAERLRLQEGDLRLWAPVNPDRLRLTDEQIARIILLAELEALGDSMALAEELARRGTDWTYTDSLGRRWGVSPGQLHLGDVTIPLPFAFGVPPGRAEQVRNRMWEWDAIERGAASGDILRTWRQRDEQIRRRMEAQRRADTTGVRR